MKSNRLIVITLFLSAILCAAEHKSIDPEQVELHKSYGGAAVDRFIRIKGLYLFRCDIKDFPSVIGKDIGVLIDNIEIPDIVKKERQPNIFFESQVEKFLEDKLRNAEEITLNRIKRGTQFHLVASVTVDGVNLGELLIREGLASRRTSHELGQSIRSRSKTATQRITPTIERDRSVRQVDTEQVTYIASKSSKVFHKSTCSHAKRITPEKVVKFATKEQAMTTGRRPCKTCNP